jgi:hypothetical protein
MIYEEHLATMTTLTDNAFGEERSSARSQYRQFGMLRLPWLRWAPQKTIADLWADSRERRKNPEYMAKLRQLQKELDDDADEIAARVQEELELRKLAQEFRQREMEEARKPIGRRYARAAKSRRPKF